MTRELTTRTARAGEEELSLESAAASKGERARRTAVEKEGKDIVAGGGQRSWVG